ncbi:MAG: tetratricopeptide repeat protein [Betaproteobacteria bacterium]|nr:MAG: tetratricopeptide repeat protein [Betaproteobacteria bacterium]
MIDADYGRWLSLGQAHQNAGRSIDAMLCYRQALKSNRHAVIVQFHLGEVMRDLGRRDDAVAAWAEALKWQPQHVPSLVALGNMLREGGAWLDAAAQYRRALALDTRLPAARRGLALALLGAGDANAYAELSELIEVDATTLADDSDFATALARAPDSPEKRDLLERISRMDGAAASPLLHALVIEHAAGSNSNDRHSTRERVRRLLDRLPSIDDPEALRRIAVATARAGEGRAWAEKYAMVCAARHAQPVPLQWPRRTAGDALRVTYLIAPGSPIVMGGMAVDPGAYLRNVVARHPRERVLPSVLIVDNSRLDGATATALAGIRVGTLGPAPDPALARALAEADDDVLIDLAGMRAATGPLLAARPARTLWTYATLLGAHAAPLVSRTLPLPASASEDALVAHGEAVEHALLHASSAESWFTERSTPGPAAMAADWRRAVAEHQAGDFDEAIIRYRGVLAEQPAFAPAHHFLGVLLRDRGRREEAAAEFRQALAGAPAYADARAALANLEREAGRAETAVALCREGLALARSAPLALLRALGLAELARHDPAAARVAFEQALALAPTDGETHYNHGVSLQTLHLRDEALRAYQRALAFAPDLIAADFNIGVILQEQGRTDAAIAAFEQVLARDPRHVLAHKALGDTLLGARRIDDWLRVFARFEASCSHALSLAVQALEVYQYRGDFAGLDRYLDRLRQDDFKPESETDLADSLEQLLFLLLYFDIEQEAHFGLYRAYDAVAQRVHGKPMPLAVRKPGRLRIGYLSGDFRNQVMGKMMWSALQHHDRDRFEIFCYALNKESDEWTDRYRAFADHFENVADVPEREAARRIGADDLDLLVDLSTHTKGAKPGILACKPARVQITHVASAGVLGLSAIDFKLTDQYADVAQNQAFQLETLLPMAGCVYPYRHIAPAPEHPFHRERLKISAEATVIGTFVNPLKLSRRCLSLWREVLERAPGALLAISPLSPEARGVYGRLFAAAGIPLSRVIVLPQGRNDGENQARYSIVDFTLDPLPYGGVNGTIEALDMGVPVVTLCGKKHGERSSYTILVNLGVTDTVAKSGSEYVDIAVRLASDAAFMTRVKQAILAGLEHSALTDMRGHTRALEAAYVEALSRAHPEALAAARR